MVVDKKDNHRSAVSVPASRLCRVALLEFLTGPDIQLAEVQFIDFVRESGVGDNCYSLERCGITICIIPVRFQTQDYDIVM